MPKAARRPQSAELAESALQPREPGGGAAGAEVAAQELDQQLDEDQRRATTISGLMIARARRVPGAAGALDQMLDRADRRRHAAQSSSRPWPAMPTTYAEQIEPASDASPARHLEDAGDRDVPPAAAVT